MKKLPKFNDKDDEEYHRFKKRILDVAMEIQMMTFKSKEPSEIFDKLIEKGYKAEECMIALDLLMDAKNNVPKIKEQAETIDKCMKTISEQTEKINTAKQFYNLVENVYLKEFMQYDESRLPICFLWNKKGKPSIGIVPMENFTGHSPMDDLKRVVYGINPDAYLFCGEASMKQMTKDEVKDYEYGALQDDPQSKDILIMIGNTREGNEEFNKLFDMKRNKEDTKWEFELNKQVPAKNLESDKLP